MDLKAKLGRLGPPVGRPGSEPGRAPVLEALREEMNRILRREAPPRPLAEPSATELPFVRVETEQGAIYRRQSRLAPSHHVGRMPVDAAAGASAGMLALLALDPSLSCCDLGRALFLDLETTGLGGGAGVLAFLVGLAYFDAEQRLVVEQLLLRSPADERALLAALRPRIDGASVIVTYNGKAFDWPLLAGRHVMNRLPRLPELPQLDLVHVARRLHRQRLGACRLVHVESDVLGFVRGPDIAGGDVPARYAHFLRTGDERALLAVVEHNALDVVSMAALVGLYGEPAETLHDEDLVGLAATFRRARALQLAEATIARAVSRGAGPSALKLRGEMAKARGDRASALADFERLSREIDDPGVRLELAKLYEHHAGDFGKALDLVARGTGEAELALERRRQRLERKLSRPAKPARRAGRAARE